MKKANLSGKTWSLYPADQEKKVKLAEELHISPFLAQILVNRGITAVEEAEKFLEPDISYLYSPHSMKDMDAAANKILEYIEKGGKIAVFGDYDVDGITATAIMYSLLSSLGGNVTYYLPERLTEGYGLSRGAVDFLRNQDVSLIVTVDCGISAVEEVSYARSLGVDVIITDHHQQGNELPHASAVVNPHREDCSYPFPDLCGAGIAFKVGQALLHYAGNKGLTGYPGDSDKDMPSAWDYLDLTALGTVADVVPLKEENRVFVAQGLQQMKKGLRPGLEGLCVVSGLDVENLDAEKLAFVLAPRLNAAGRLGNAETSFNLLLERDREAALKLAEELQRENNRRQSLEAQIFNEAFDMAQRQQEKGEGENFLLLASENWHHGVLGIVASRMMERFNIPVMLIALEEGIGKGSGRSLQGFDIYQALHTCSSLLISFGGHEFAAGLTTEEGNIPLLREKLELLAKEFFQERGYSESDFYVDAVLEPGDISPGLVQELEKLQPFGYGNPRPLFYSENWLLENEKEVGQGGRHLKFVLRKAQQAVEAISFNGRDTLPKLRPLREVDPLFTLSMSRWKGREQLQMEVNYFYYSDEYKESSISLIDRRELEKEASKISYLKEILRREGEILVFVNTRREIDRLKRLFSGWEGLLFSHQGDVPSLAGNANCHHLILYDLPIRKDSLLKLLRNLVNISDEGELKIHLLYGYGDYQANLTLLLATVPLPASVEQIYYSLKELFPKGRMFFPDVINTLPELLTFPVTNTLIKKCLTILQEASYVKFNREELLLNGENEGHYCSFVRDISQVESMIEEKKRWRETLTWQKLLLETSPEELFSSIRIK